MYTLKEVKARLAPGGAWNGELNRLYGPGDEVNAFQAARYARLASDFAVSWPEIEEAALFSTPGRTEVIGNHTDHNAGFVLAAAIDLDIIALAAPRDGNVVTICSTEYDPIEVDITTLEAVAAEQNTSAAIVRGVCARMKALGYRVGGFCAQTASTVLQGSGLSSSAAFEVLVVSILSHLYNKDAVSPILAAQIAQFSENDYFGKPCGLMDQTTCAVGGFVFIDFEDFERPVVEQIGFDFGQSGYSMVIVDTGGSHADLTEDYTLLENEMKDTAKAMGEAVLRPLSAEGLQSALPQLRAQGLSDRAILRAFHYFDENSRVLALVDALRGDDLDTFKRLIIESGYSSWMLCQNVYSCKHPHTQGASIALEVSRRILEGKGAWRVHGGGFAGTIQAFVPQDLLGDYVGAMEALYGAAAIYQLFVRPEGMFVFK